MGTFQPKKLVVYMLYDSKNKTYITSYKNKIWFNKNGIMMSVKYRADKSGLEIHTFKLVLDSVSNKEFILGAL